MLPVGAILACSLHTDWHHHTTLSPLAATNPFFVLASASVDVVSHPMQPHSRSQQWITYNSRQPCLLPVFGPPSRAPHWHWHLLILCSPRTPIPFTSTSSYALPSPIEHVLCSLFARSARTFTVSFNSFGYRCLACI